MNAKYLDLKNERFGMLVAKEFSNEVDSNGTTKKWRCQCDCGNFINVSARHLIESRKHNRNINCGCSMKKNYINNVFGDYLVVSYNPNERKGRFKCYNCKCVKCGKEEILSTDQLMNNKMCQECHKKEARIIELLKHKLTSIRRRCYKENSPDYKNYGARGIKVCEEWLGDSDNFVRWALENGYKENLTIDRIDNNGNYCPENCRWVTREVQNNNKRDNLIIEYKGKKQTLKQWCRELNLNYRNTHKRIYSLHWSIEKAFTQ